MVEILLCGWQGPSYPIWSVSWPVAMTLILFSSFSIKKVTIPKWPNEWESCDNLGLLLGTSSSKRLHIRIHPWLLNLMKTDILTVSCQGYGEMGTDPIPMKAMGTLVTFLGSFISYSHYWSQVCGDIDAFNTPDFTVLIVLNFQPSRNTLLVYICLNAYLSLIQWLCNLSDNNYNSWWCHLTSTNC